MLHRDDSKTMCGSASEREKTAATRADLEVVEGLCLIE
jgi:hypothetical protein